MRTNVVRMVMSSTMIGMSRVPTGTLRTSTSETTTFCIVWIRMVMSAAAAFGMSHLLPTGSPSTNAVSVVYGGIAFSVNITGDTYLDMYGIGSSSYGRFTHSPDLFGDSSKDGWRIASSGSVGSLGDHYVYDSYG